MSKPIAVLISDVHYNIQTLQLADAAMRMAIDKANSLEVPLIIAGDLHDTKANMRGECVNAICKTLNLCEETPYVLIGNHDKINEKSEDNEHSLGFMMYMNKFVQVVSKPTMLNHLPITLIPYQANTSKFMEVLTSPMLKDFIICHQGLNGSNMGDYIQDKTALNLKDVSGLRIISGHYHSRQTIALPDGGKWDYIGNPYSSSWGEAKDPEKGFQILYDDGSLEFVPTRLRQHVIWEMKVGDEITKEDILDIHCDDLLWIKISDTRENLALISRNSLEKMLGRSDFKLTLNSTNEKSTEKVETASQSEHIDNLIDRLDESVDTKNRLKSTWKELCE